MTRLSRLLLPLGLPLVVAVGLVVPQLGGSVGSVTVGPASFGELCITVIFFVTGVQTQLTGAGDPGLLRAIAIVLVINLLLAPILAWGADSVLVIPLGLAVGIALMASVPTTLSSAAVISINAGGDRLWAVMLTVVTVLVGSITAPLAVSAILGADLSIEPWPILRQVLLLVLAPTVAGYLVRKSWWRHPQPWVGVIPTVAVLAVVWVTMSSSAEAAKDLDAALLLAMAAAAAVGHGALLAAAGVASRQMPLQHAMPVLFVASQKTLPLALTILTLVVDQVPDVAAVAAVATIACLVWHFLQLFVDSALSHRLAIRRAAAG